MTDASTGLVAKLAKCQGLFPPIVKSHTNPAFKGSQYADVADVLAAVRPVLAAEGMAVTQVTSVDSETGAVLLVTTLMCGSEKMSSNFPLHIAGLNAQGVGSLMTYHRRYQLCALLGVHPVGDDDDGDLAATAQTAEPEEHPEVEMAREAAQEAIAALDEPDRELVKLEIRNQKIPSLKRPGATAAQLETLREFVQGLRERREPFEVGPVEGEGVLSAGDPESLSVTTTASRSTPSGSASNVVPAPSRPEPDAIPFNPVVALPNDSGSARKVRDAIKRGVE